MRAGVPRSATAAVAAVLVLALAGCGDGEGGAGSTDDEAAWRTSTDPVAVDGLAYAVGSTVHLGDGTTVETGRPVGSFVVAGDGVLLTAEGDDPSLLFAAPGREPEETGLEVDPGLEGPLLAASPDGTAVVLMDVDADDGTGVMRFFDLATGEAHTSDAGWDTDDLEDPADHLAEVEPRVVAVTDDLVHARVPEGDFVYTWDGEGRPPQDDETPPGLGADPLRSPDEAWGIEPSGRPPRDRLVPRTGDPVDPRVDADGWTLVGWVDGTTVLGVTLDGPEARPRALVTCTVPSGECEELEGTAGQRVVLPLGDPLGPSYDLTGEG